MMSFLVITAVSYQYNDTNMNQYCGSNFIVHWLMSIPSLYECFITIIIAHGVEVVLNVFYLYTNVNNICALCYSEVHQYNHQIEFLYVIYNYIFTALICMCVLLDICLMCVLLDLLSMFSPTWYQFTFYC